MTTVKNKTKTPNSNFLSYDDLELGTVFETSDGFVLMKVAYLMGYEPKYFVMNMKNFELYDDVYNYNIIKIVDTNIIIG